MPAGSYLAISYPAAADLIGQEGIHSVNDSWNGRAQQQIIWRSREQVARFFDGTNLIEPGLVPVEQWRPEPGTGGTGKSSGWAAIGRKG